jgi:protocatechuate 3,4-dioxygenase beta subunit
MLRKLAPLTLLTAAAALISLSSRSQAQQQAAVGKPDNSATTGAISGKVVNESGQPLPGAIVRIYAANSVGQARTSAADNEGNFYINGLDPAAYFVYASLPSYVPVPREVEATAPYYRLGDSVRVELTKGGVVTGTVTSAEGEPVVAVRVRAIQIRNAKGEPPKAPIPFASEQSTDDRGIYRIYGLSPGTYVINAGGVGNQTYIVSAYDSDAPTYAPSSTRDTAAEIAVRAGEESTIDIRYRGETGYVVSGTVKGPSMGASITLMSAGPLLGQGGNTYLPPGSRSFSFNGIADGEYYVIAQGAVANQQETREMLMSEPRRITVKGADVAGLELETRSLASISGRFLLEPSKAQECQAKRQPLFAETLITLERKERASDKDPVFLPYFSSSASTDKDGAFVFRNLGPAQYSFTPRFFARYWFVQSITLPPGPTSNRAPNAVGRIDAARNWISVKWGDRITGLTITLAEGGASLRGRVTPPAEGSKLPAGLLFYLVPAEREKADDVLRFFISEVAADGMFALNNLPPGRYFILAQGAQENEPTSLTKLRLPNAADLRTKLRQKAEIAKKEIEFKPCQNVADYQLQYK